MQSIRGVVFDLDGTLVEFKIDYKSMRAEMIQALEKLGLSRDVFSIKDDLSKLLEKSEFLLQHSPELGVSLEEVRQTLFDIADKYEMEAARQVGLIPGAKEALQRVLDMELKTGLFTSNGFRATTLILQRFNLERFFEVVVPRENAPAIKPNPSHLFAVVYPMRLEPEQVVVVGDTVLDVSCAKIAGAKAVAVTTGPNTRKELLRAGADMVISTVFDVPDALKALAEES